jgi:cytochrome c biogenesis protein CcmG/thiol:disulfide interchange protein DsbE
VNRKVLLGGLLVTLPLVALLFLSLGRDPHKVDSPLLGREAPRFALPVIGGNETVTLDSLRGRTVVMNFWATWCVPCYQEHPVLAAGPGRFGGEVVFLGVVYQDEQATVERFLREQGSAYRSLMDEEGKVAIAYGVYGVPETFFISPAGTIVDKHVGPLTASLLNRYVERARSGGAPRPGGVS